jgi:hypothetical protein
VKADKLYSGGWVVLDNFVNNFVLQEFEKVKEYDKSIRFKVKTTHYVLDENYNVKEVKKYEDFVKKAKKTLLFTVINTSRPKTKCLTFLLTS